MAGAASTIAIAHDYLTQQGGAERVVLALSRAFPEAPIYTTLYDPATTFPEFGDRQVVTSPLNRLAFLRRDHRAALPLLAPASNAVRIDADVVIASSSGWAHGFRSTGRTLVYCHNPARWLYQTDQYLGDAGRLSPKRFAVTALGPALRRWDRRAAHRADRYLANSNVVRERIAAAYGIEADVVPPPPGLGTGGEQSAHRELTDWQDRRFWLVVSRLMPYKNVDVVLDAFRDRPDDRLVIVGAGPERERLVQMLPPNARIVSGVSDAELRWIYAHAAGLIAPSHEDFGLTPLEANSWGLPVVALRAGGYLDTVVEGRSGLFFEEVQPAAVSRALDAASAHAWHQEVLKAHAQEFGEGRFAARIRQEVERLLDGPAAPGP
ncbi:glycosyltransferase [Ornithinimicrobium tianjinense]|uniref:D-inositol 3-phosphate glycosyltransferase n=1 Tax=Ornithinimicrobium tianjinense TaxID=1195761 RepID=A0A917BRG3_9MICO|nr:glycosyltransferase [Ornithinimicrobium tianjinense]GGF53687.1 glycosyl transferase [Ornithinimicrobium tianjinense]